MSELEQHLRSELSHSGRKGPLDPAPVDGVLAWIAGQPGGVTVGYAKVLPIATVLAQKAADDTLRTGATRLVGRLYPLTEPITPASVAFDPNATRETLQRYAAERAAYRKRGVDTLLALAHDPVATVAASAAIELLATATVEERRALRPELHAVAPTLEAAVQLPEVAAALLHLRGAPQATHWLADYAAHRPIPIKIEQIAMEVKMEPTPESLAALEAAITADPIFQDQNFEPKLSPMATTLRLPVYDADTERVQQLLASLHAVDKARAAAVADRAAPKLSARLKAFLATRPKTP